MEPEAPEYSAIGLSIICPFVVERTWRDKNNGGETTSCKAPLVFDTPRATDHCGSPARVFTSVAENRHRCGNGSVTKTWTATDTCGNTSTISRTLTVEHGVAVEVTKTTEGAVDPASNGIFELSENGVVIATEMTSSRKMGTNQNQRFAGRSACHSK